MRIGIAQIDRYFIAKKQYNIDIHDIDVDPLDIGSIHRLDEYKLIGKLRLALIFIPFYYMIFKRKYTYQYMQTFSEIITIASKSDKIIQLFNAYAIFIRKKYGYYAYVAHYKAPEEFDQAHISNDLRSQLMIQSFQDNALKILDDISSSSISDLLNIDSLSDVSRMEMHLEPLGYYEIVALKELKLYTYLMSFAYLCILTLFLYYFM